MRWWNRTEYARTVILVLGGLVVVWEMSVRLLGVRAFILPAPSQIAVEATRSWSFFALQSLYTIYVTVVGFVLAVLGGIVLAFAIVSSRFIERIFYTLLVALNSVPKVALAPLFVIWLGTASAPKI